MNDRCCFLFVHYKRQLGVRNQEASARGRLIKHTSSVVISIGATEEVRLWEGPLWEVPLYNFPHATQKDNIFTAHPCLLILLGSMGEIPIV